MSRSFLLKNSEGEQMTRIENKTDMLIWARHINNNIINMPMSDKCDLQDIWGHSAVGKIQDAFIACEGERKLVICSVSNVMDFQQVEDLLSHLAQYKCRKQREIDEEEFIKRDAELFRKEQAFKDAMKPYHKRMKELRRQNELLKSSNESIQQLADHRLDEMRAAKRDANDYHEKAIKYDQIRSLLS